jgi:hypothetical protein
MVDGLNRGITWIWGSVGADRKLTDIYVDGDACPVREEVYRVAARLRLNVFVVSNGSRPIRPPGTSNVHMVLVGDNADAADDWITDHITAIDVCVTSDIPLASRCLKRGPVSSRRPEHIGRKQISVMRLPAVRSPDTCGRWERIPVDPPR